MELKKSQYNYVVSLENNDVVVFNGVSKAIGRFKPQQFDIVKTIFEKPNVPVNTFQDGFIIKSYLIRNGFLISKNFDEFEILKERNRIAINGKYSFDLLILPTLDCNFRCFYCYEEHRPVHMSQKVEEGIKNWTKKNLESYPALNLSWFGGEPLLRVDTILRLSDFFQNFCKQHGKVFTNMITTNGYLLTRDNINKLKDVGLKHFHVTLDGSSHWHNQFRVHRNNSATYTQIVDGVNRVLDQIQDARITIR